MDSPPQPVLVQAQTVSEFIDEEQGTWNITKLQAVLFPIDFQEIIQIPLNRLNTADSISWKGKTEGNFLVKDAYQLIQEMHAAQEGTSISSTTLDPELNQVWKLQVQPKIKHFLWWLLADTLPTAVNLQKRKVKLEEACKFCRSHREDASHLFLSCPFVQEICRELGVSPQLHGVFEPKEAFSIRRKGLSGDLCEKWCVGLWELWNQRNNILYGKPLKRPVEVALFSVTFQENFRAAIVRKKNAHRPPEDEELNL